VGCGHIDSQPHDLLYPNRAQLPANCAVRVGST
jgi:hypothetical protein